MNQYEDADGFARAALVLTVLSVASLFIPFLAPSVTLAAAVCGFFGRKSVRYRNRSLVCFVVGLSLLLISVVLLVAIGALTPYLEELYAAMVQYMQ